MQAKTSQDPAQVERLEHEWRLAMLQQELLEAVEKALDIAQRSGADTAMGVPLDTLRQKKSILQLQSLSASDLFNGISMVRFKDALQAVTGMIIAQMAVSTSKFRKRW